MKWSCLRSKSTGQRHKSCYSTPTFDEGLEELGGQEVTRTDTFSQSSEGWELVTVCDNWRSWVYNLTPHHRNKNKYKYTYRGRTTYIMYDNPKSHIHTSYSQLKINKAFAEICIRYILNSECYLFFWKWLYLYNRIHNLWLSKYF